jgi:hypothetical protein
LPSAYWGETAIAALAGAAPAVMVQEVMVIIVPKRSVERRKSRIALPD